jgi:hypothetical protein
MSAEAADPIVQIVDGEEQHIRPRLGGLADAKIKENHRDTEAQRGKGF